MSRQSYVQTQWHPAGIRPPPLLAGCFLRWQSLVPGAALPVAPSRVTPRPACGVHLYSPLALDLSHFWEPRVSSLTLQKPLVAMALHEPPLLTAPGTRVRLRAPRHPNTPRLRRLSPRTRRGWARALFLKHRPFYLIPYVFILILHITVNL